MIFPNDIILITLHKFMKEFIKWSFIKEQFPGKLPMKELIGHNIIIIKMDQEDNKKGKRKR